MPPITAERTLERPLARPTAPKSSLRNDIQGLRAIAVGSVLLYHMGAPFIPGGFVGVDVFFVISGFLISGLIIRELQRTGTFSFSAFYARRLKRLAPVYLLVLLASGTAVMTLLTPLQAGRYVKDLIAAALYGANFNFATQTSGYFADPEPSPFVHFWSLAVEEQFYFVWPIMLFLVLHRARRSRHLLWYLLGGVFAVSLALSIVLSHSQPTSSYYLLHTRAWELAAGALTYLVSAKLTALNARLRGLLLGVGLSAIVLSALLITKSMEFPGWVALFPVLGTVAIILAGSGGTMPPGANRILGNRPMLFLGNISYSLYLWHWPLLVIPQLLAGGPLRLREKAVLALAAVVLATLTYYFVEKPFQALNVDRRKRMTYAVALGTTAVLVAGFGGWGLAQQQSLQSAQALSKLTVAADRAGAGLEPFADPLVDASGRWIPQANAHALAGHRGQGPHGHFHQRVQQQRRGLQHHGLRIRQAGLTADSRSLRRLACRALVPGPEESRRRRRLPAGHYHQVRLPVRAAPHHRPPGHQWPFQLPTVPAGRSGPDPRDQTGPSGDFQFGTQLRRLPRRRPRLRQAVGCRPRVPPGRPSGRFRTGDHWR